MLYTADMKRDAMSLKIRMQQLIPVMYFGAALAIFATVATPNATQLAGMIMAVPAFVLWLIARFQLGSSFTIRPHASPLVTSGIYAKIRHPVYVFSFFAWLGVILFFDRPYLWPLPVTLIVVQILRARREEQVLSEKYGRIYDDYRRKTWF
jgi:protein-S-isoprenylcysteine O-methyltransferase Ste14